MGAFLCCSLLAELPSSSSSPPPAGLANALDLTDRTLARLGAHPAGSPRLLHFPPYTKEQLTRILQERLGQVGTRGARTGGTMGSSAHTGGSTDSPGASQVPGDPVLDCAALQFCARKVSAVSGDARKALDVCRSVCAPKPGGASASFVPLSPHGSPALGCPCQGCQGLRAVPPQARCGGGGAGGARPDPAQAAARG